MLNAGKNFFQKNIVYLILIAVTLAVYWQVNGFDFVNFDDGVYVTQNSRVISGMTWKGFHWAFFTTYAEFWHPLTWLSLMFDSQLYGLHAGGFHLTNLILHIMSTLLAFWFLNRVTGKVWRSAFVAAFFALHPLHVESVAWVAERKDVLSGFFWMLTLCLYVFYTEKSSPMRYLAVLFCFVLALMSKPIVITLPVVMILLDYWPLKRFAKREANVIIWQIKEKAPFFVLSAAFSIFTYLAQYNPAAVDIPLGSRLSNAFVSFEIYLEKSFWPQNLAVFYPFPPHISLWQISGAALLLIFITTMAILTVRRRPYFFVGWFWYVITLVPVIGIVQVGKQAMADRFMYLPLIGLGIMLAWGVPSLFGKENVRRIILIPLGAFFILALAFGAWRQCHYWENSFSLFNHALSVTKNNYLAHHNLGLALFAEGKYEGAVNYYNDALQMKPPLPDRVLIYNNRAISYSRLGLNQKALDDLNEAIRLSPDYADAYSNRGIVYSSLGQSRLAFEDFNKAIQMNPGYADLYENRGVACTKLGLYRQAVEDFTKAIELRPENADAFYKRGVVYLQLGDKTSGCLDAEKACELGNCSILESARGKGDCR